MSEELESQELESTRQLGLQSVSHAVEKGASDARRAVGRVLPAAGRAVSQGVYRSCYYASYGVVFGGLTVAQLVPRDNAAVHGLQDGAQVARKAVDHREENRLEAGEPVEGLVSD